MVKLGKGIAVRSNEWYKNWKQPKIEHMKLTKWYWLVAHPENFKLGKDTDIGAFTYINAQYGVEVGDDVEIGGGCFIYSFSTIDKESGKIIIGKKAKIGAQSTILPGVTIGEGAIIGAHSLVKNNVEPFTIVMGVPAKPLIRKKCPRCLMEF